MSPPASNRSSRPIRSTAEFARYVGLARTTVSRVLNGQPGLKQKTIDRVRRAMDETGFTVNAYALHLKGKRTASIGICVETLFTPPAVAKLAILQRRMRAREVSSMIEVVDPESIRGVIRHFLSMRVSAVVFIGHFNEAEIGQRIEELSAHGIPHLVVDQAGIPNANTVSLDRRKAMAEMTRHLLGLGHDSFGLLGLSGTQRSVQDRLGGMAEALVAAGLSLEASTLSLDHLHPRTAGDVEFGRSLARSFLAVKRVPTAFVALNDEIAIGAIHGFQEAGVRVPEDVSVSGFNNQDICKMVKPALTSVDQQIEATVEAAADILISKIEHGVPRTPVVRTIQPLLVIRESTAKARSAIALRGRTG
ncbi:MAG TPA: LacI family DNA-binding transcriptional regulator [Opitutaceae bacterium]